ncbi:Prolamin-like domain [Arabidopsis suecica]|uniref:Prolamin-like domain n=1 Tax=Arabidopsis suecica TaxID=45249 RepID=A0A8T1ZZF3_ARASU|nr:Prolamin-like domain [Arabidopsis suecica]
MENKSGAILCVILAMAIFLQVRPGLAQILPHIPEIFPPGSPIDIVKCSSSLFNVQGCVQEIYNSIFSGQFANIEAACCKIFLAIDTNCWPRMFPLNPFFPPLLKNNCERIATTPSSTHK